MTILQLSLALLSLAFLHVQQISRLRLPSFYKPLLLPLLQYYDGIAESLVLCIVGIVSERWLKSLGLFCLSSLYSGLRQPQPALSRIVLHFSILRVVSQFKWTLRYSIYLSVGCHSLLPVLYLILSAIFWPLTLATVFDVFTCLCCRFPLLLSLSLYSFSCCCGYVS